MLDYIGILSVTLPVYLLMVTGAALRKTGILPTESDKGLMKLCVTILTPALILERVAGNPAVMEPVPVLVAAGLGYALVVIGIFISYALAPLIGLRVHEGRRTFGVACGLQNYGFVAIPIVAALFKSPGMLGVLFTFTLGIEMACWTACVGMLTGFNKAPLKLALNPPVITILVALLLNFTGLHGYIPAVAHNTLGMLGACAVPLAVLLIGASIADIWGLEPMNWKIAVLSPILRLFLIPLIFLAAAVYLPISVELKRILIVQAAMPSAVFNIVIARLYGGHPATAVQTVLATTVVSCVTTPFVIAWALKWVGV